MPLVSDIGARMTIIMPLDIVEVKIHVRTAHFKSHRRLLGRSTPCIMLFIRHNMTKMAHRWADTVVSTSCTLLALRQASFRCPRDNIRFKDPCILVLPQQ